MNHRITLAALDPRPSRRPPPRDHFIALAGDDGHFEVWRSIAAKTSFVDSPIIWPWFMDVGLWKWRWASAADRSPARQRCVLVIARDEWHVFGYAAALAAELAGITAEELARLDRGADGFFRCPKCRKLYDRLGDFHRHLACDCIDDGAAAFVWWNLEFNARNRRTRRAWLNGSPPAANPL